jgi:hypothetical protein
MSEAQDPTLADDVEVTEPLDEADDTQEQQQTEEVVEETEEQQPIEDAEEQAKWKTRHRSPEEVFEENRRLQSELDKKKRELESKGVEVKPPTSKTTDDMLREFAANPKGFVEQFIAPVAAKQSLNDFLSDPQNSERFGQYRNEVVQRVGGNLTLLSDPNVLKAVFLLVEDEMKSAKLNDAYGKIQEHRDEVTNIKKTKAFTEGTTTAGKKTVAPTIKPGMTQSEMEKILDARGVPKIER